MRGLLLRFAVGAMVGVLAAVAVGVVLAKPPITSDAIDGDPVSLVDGNGGTVDFTIVKTDAPEPLEPLPVDATIQLTAFHAAATDDPGGLPVDPWWSNSVPRIDHITQFDGGPLEKVNCLMAAAAMLARLGYGIVTTGSQLRALSGDTELGTTYSQAQGAVDRGWGVRFFQGALTPLQLRAVLWAGAGAIVDGVYGKIPVRWRVQKNFEGRHAIYVDAFSPTAVNGGPAYYVMDPIGRRSRGYNGAWWPADAVEAMIAELPGGRIATMWAFPGGKPPVNRPILPPEFYPDPRPGETPLPTTLPSGEVVDPYPPDDVPPPPDTDDGVDPGVDLSEVTVELTEGGGLVYPVDQPCVTERKIGCPVGIVGIINLLGLGPQPTRPPLGIDILYGGLIGEGMYQIIFEPPPDASRTELLFWSDVGGAKLEAATVEEGTLDGKPVSIGTILLDPTLDYSFVATAEGDGLRTVSTVGGIEVRQ